MSEHNNIKEIARLFLKLGFTAFGGPAGHTAMMREEVVVKRNWLSEQQFLDLMGATNLIPGPNSTELAIHIGKEKGGWKGMLVAGSLFILPAVLITGIFAYLYKIYGQLPQVEPFVYGIKPAIIAIILAAVYPLGKQSVKSKELAIVGLLVLIFSFFVQNEILLMFGFGLLFMLYKSLKEKHTLNSFFPIPFLSIPLMTTISVTNLKLFWIFLKIGAVLYGSGYVLFAFLDSELVTTGILSRQELIDAIAVGQFTPGPVTSSVTFIGYQINGIWGAIISTFAVFLPSFIFVALLNPILKFFTKINTFLFLFRCSKYCFGSTHYFGLHHYGKRSNNRLADDIHCNHQPFSNLWLPKNKLRRYHTSGVFDGLFITSNIIKILFYDTL